jgi:hypothetical protein
MTEIVTRLKSNHACSDELMFRLLSTSKMRMTMIIEAFLIDCGSKEQGIVVIDDRELESSANFFFCTKILVQGNFQYDLTY